MAEQHQLLSQLEVAAELMTAAPHLVSNEQRHAAEQIFLDFRNLKSPYAVCKQILDNSSVPYILFETAETLKLALIRDWFFLLEADKSSLRQYLMHYITAKELPPFVCDKILQVIAIMVKRNSVNDLGKEREAILQEVENIIINAEPKKKLLGFKILANLMQEYASTVRSTDVGLPWEVHFKVKKQFEANDLKRIFQFCVQLFSEMVKNDAPYCPNMLDFMKYLLQISENVLTWGFISPSLPKRLIGIYEAVYESDQTPTLRLGHDWADIILDPALVPLFFQIYWKVKDYDELAHHALSCLAQLASLNGAVVAADKVRFDYLTIYFENFSKLISSIVIKSKQSLGISNIIKKLVISFTHDLPNLPNQLQISYLDDLTRLTCSFCEGAAIDELKNEDEKFYNDAFENMLEAWGIFIQEYTRQSLISDVLQDSSIRIFNIYVQFHLTSPSNNVHNLSNNTDNVEYEDDDRILFRDQLQTIGMFGRLIPSHALPVLFDLLEDRIARLKSNLQSVNRNNTMISATNESDNLNIFEDIHWIILIAGHILCMDSDGETPLIPSEIMQYSLDNCQKQQFTVDASLQVLASIHDLTKLPDGLKQCDHIVRLTSDIMRLCVIENSIVEINGNHLISPAVSSTILWFLRRWCLSYLLPVEHYYQEISPTFVRTFGDETEGSKFALNFLIDKIYLNLCYFHSEPHLIKDTINLFKTIVSLLKQQKSLHIIQSDAFWKLFTLQNKLESGTLPSTYQRDFIECFVKAGVVLRDVQEMNVYYEKILGSIQARFKALISRQDICQSCHKEDVQLDVINLLECLIGVTKGCQMVTVQVLFQFIAPILSEMSVFLKLFNNYQIVVQLILNLFGQCAKNMLCFLTQLDSKKLYECALATIQIYVKCNANKFTRNVSDDTDSSYEDLVLILNLLIAILSKDCVDLSPNNDEEITITASDVSLFGLNFIMPLMTVDLLKYPSLCSKYYKLLVLINDIYPEKICNISSDLLQNLFSSIELGLNQFDSDIVQNCLDFVQGMSVYFFKNNLANTNVCQAMRPFLKMIMNLVLTNQISSDLISSTSICIYSLICCYKDEYRRFVEEFVGLQPESLVRERLGAAFDNLTLNVAMSAERQAKLKFKDNFERFVANVHGFLLVK